MKPHHLQALGISGPDQVWCSDITYVPMASGFVYLVAVMEWWRLYVVAWELSNSLESECCIVRQHGEFNRREHRLRSRGALQRLEPDEGKLSRPVLRGGSGSNAATYPTMRDKVLAVVIPWTFRGSLNATQRTRCCRGNAGDFQCGEQN